ncbi:MULTISPECIES: sulfatase [unclassified Spirosoma]|uniref:sulfatase n=1 Tax=unclassified Spirosoma TaxID=2621999 RepID=UPI000965B70C|nr:MULTISPECIES: sulfatase [unclassified Spirosoma]MBN8824903.1 sulfatase [Spirosoma sp.]OJW74773.1 MAG: aryl-sulfate sulfohydrolase [Spirosoma sp. 48-14]
MTFHKHPIRILFCLTLASALSVGLMLPPKQLQSTSDIRQHTARPNIVFILADDLGWKDVGFMGSTFYETPNLDRLAAQGIRFTSAYAAAANCAPSRACLLSGQYSPRHGIYTVANADRGDAKTRKLMPVKNNEVLPDSVYTLAEALRDAGYQTASIGKWHLGKSPESHGFSYSRAGDQRGMNRHFSPYGIPNLPDGPTGEYLTDRLTDEALAFLDQTQQKANAARPFFLYLPFYAVHTPLQAPDSLITKYERKPKTPGQNHTAYAAMIESLDRNVGRVLKKLDALGLDQNTLVIFTSDNGGIRSISRQDPLRAGKGSYYEGGVRVPLVVRWPGTIRAGSTSQTPVINLDFYPTFQDILKLPNPKQPLDGISIIPLLTGKSVPERPFFWHFPIYLEAYDPKTDGGRDPLFRTRPGSTVRLGDWKLHEYFEDNGVELYNLKTDLGEQRNVASANPAVVKKLHKLVQDWRTKQAAFIPTEPNPAYVAP